MGKKKSGVAPIVIKEREKANKKSKKKFVIISIILVLFLSMIICVMFLLGVFSPKWKKQIGFSNLKVKKDYVVGEIQNKTDKHLKLEITFELKSGSINDEDFCYVNIEPNDIEDLECLVYGKNSSYSVKVKNVEVSEIKEKSFKDGQKLSSSDIENYFEDIYDQHTSLFLNLFGSRDEEFDEIPSYPYLGEVEYRLTDDRKAIYIYNSVVYNKTPISVFEYYDIEKKELYDFSILFEEKEDVLEYFKKWIPMTILFNEDLNTSYSYRIKQVLSNNSEEGRCTSIGKYCYSKSQFAEGRADINITTEFN